MEGMSPPQSLSVLEVRNFMLANNCKVTNHALVKHFKRFLTGPPEVQNEARNKFKTYVNLLATIKNENNQKYLLLRKKYINECPTTESVLEVPNNAISTGESSFSLDTSKSSSPYTKETPPYKPPPPPMVITAVSRTPARIPAPQFADSTARPENVEAYTECAQEFTLPLCKVKLQSQSSTENGNNYCELKKEDPDIPPLTNATDLDKINKENQRLTVCSSDNLDVFTVSNNKSTDAMQPHSENENSISVKEATRKFNRMASKEETKVFSPSSKKKPEDGSADAKDQISVTYNHPKAKEWIVVMAKSNYQELAKLTNKYPELIKLPDPATGYTALHWAAKHGNEDVVKLVAGTYKGEINVRSNGGYTPLHLAVQFDRMDIFNLLCNVYKANRDIVDWSGKKPLDYTKQSTSVSASTYSKIKARRKHAVERELSFLRIGSLNVRVKKTTEAFSNFLGVGGNGSATIPLTVPQHHLHNHMTVTKTNTASLELGKDTKLGMRASVPPNNKKFDNVYKTWGSADNIPNTKEDTQSDIKMMPPPKSADSKKRSILGKRGSFASCDTETLSHSTLSSNTHSAYSSMPTTPSQFRSPLYRNNNNNNNLTTMDSDSDSACGFGSHWYLGESKSANEMKCTEDNLE